MSSWYDDCFFLLHYNHPYSAEYGAPSLVVPEPDQVLRLLREVRPDAVHYTAKGQAGVVPYPTRFGNHLPSISVGYPGGAAEEQPEILQVFRDATREMGIHLILGYGGLIDRHAADWRPGWLRMKSDYSPYPNRALCPNNGYVDELMLPQLEELVERYRPDGIWVDGDNWTVSPCYCSACASDFQMLHERSAPLELKDPFWPQWLEFHRESFRRYVTRLARYLHDRDTGLAYASSGGWCTHQPEPVAPGPERLTWDLSPAFALRQAGLEARFLDSRGSPFDLISPAECSPRPHAAGRLPALPAYPKTSDHLSQEGSAVLANGGRWGVWLDVPSDGALPEARHGLAAEAAQFSRERQPWCMGTRSGAYIAVLHSAATHQKAGNGLYDPGPSLDRIRGAHQMLLELHQPHDIVNEETLLRELGRYWVVVLPEQIALPAELDQPLTDWIREGGRLIASGRVGPRLIEDIPTFALEEALGVRWTGRQEAEGCFPHRGDSLRIAAPAYLVSPADAEVILPLLRSAPEGYGQMGSPAVTSRPLGEGTAFYIATDLFTAYHRCQYPGLREVFADIMERALPQPPMLTSAPASVEVVLRIQEGRTTVHFVNHSPGKSLAQNSAYVEQVPPTEPFSLSLAVSARPLDVRLQPADTEPDWTWMEGTLTVFIPPVHLHTLLVIEEAPGGPPLAGGAAPEV